MSSSSPSSLVKSLSPELKKDLLGEGTLKRLRFKSVEEELRHLEGAGFPLPTSLDRRQWRRLIELPERDLRTRYLDCVVQSNEEAGLAEMADEVSAASKGLRFSEDMFEGMSRGEDEAASSFSLREHVARIQHIYDEMFQTGELLPLALEENHLRELAEARSKSRIEKTLRYLGLRRMTRTDALVAKRADQVEGERERSQIREDRAREQHLVYGLANNAILLRKYPADMDFQESWREAREFNEWGQPLVVDLAFLNRMNFKQMKTFLKELIRGLKDNRSSRLPFAVHLCNFSSKCDKCQFMRDSLPHIFHASYPLVISEGGYLDIFPAEKLVYLSPDSANELDSFSSEDVYVIGGLVERLSQEKLSLVRAKKDRLRHAKLPLRKHIG